MTSHMITSTEASRHFSDLLNQVHYQGHTFKIKRGGKIVAELVPVKTAIPASKFSSFLKNLPLLDDEDKSDLQKIINECRADLNEMRNPWD